ncbi:MAG TPA: carboxypeptidase regulatory-like domain-containing protein [Bryobacterales bacterium]|nr:carboxypeptidase regulatory-like domain-containing protein [Bryobacterales bacterium]
MLRKNLFATLVILLLVASVPALRAQTATGTIIGHVSDPSGAVLANVNVTALNPEKGTTFRAATDAQGIYRFFYLEPASYTLSFELSGFASMTRPGVALRSNDTLSIDVQMNVGNVVEKVEVTATTPLLETATSTTGTVVAGSFLNTIPVEQRYIFLNTYYLPGVTAMNGYHISGTRDRGFGLTLDGISGVEPIRQGVATNRIMSTTPNAIQEVKLVTTVLPAEDGHTAGGLMSATYVSGTNKLHFEVEDRYLGNAELHRAFFNLQKSTTPLSYHELSALVSGPVYIPKLYNGKNKTFFMFGISRHDERYFQQQFSTVPTPEELNGDFSFGGLGYPIYDPASTAQGANNQWTSQRFANNVIPKSRFDPAVVNFLGHNPWNLPNNLGGGGQVTATGPQLNYGGAGQYLSFRTRFDVKIDHNFSDKHRIFGRYSHIYHRQNGSTVALAWSLLDQPFVVVPVDQQNAVVDDTYVFGPSMINEVRLGYNRRMESRTPPGTNADWAHQLGIPGVSGVTFPSFFDSGGNQFFGASFPGGFYYTQDQNYTFQDNFTLIRGRHSFKTGYELLRTSADSLIPSQPGGVFRFGGTGFPFTPNTGNDFAGFLLGSVVRSDFNTTLANWLPRWWSHALYFQDDWNATSRLTFNLGLRWSFETPYNTKYGQQSQFDPAATDPLTGLKGAITHPSGALGRTNYNHFQPRIGVAYKFANNMVFRGGFGITTVDLFSTDVNQLLEEYTTSVSVQRPSGDPRPAFFLSQGPGPLNYNILNNGTSPFVGVNYSSRGASERDPNLRNPYVMNWNATYQYQFRPSWLAEFSYQGSAGVGLFEAWNINQVPFNVSSDPSVLSGIYKNYQIYRPFPNFGAINLWSNFGHSTYHSGTVKLEKRYSKEGLTLTSFYTFSKAIDDCDNDQVCNGADFYNRALEKGRAGYDITNRFVTYLTLEAPFGKGRRWMNGGGFKDWFLGGWNIAWTQTFQDGTPVAFTLAGSPYQYLSSPAGTIMRPNQIAPNSAVIVNNWHIGDRFAQAYENPMWNISGFANPGPFTLGQVGRNTITGPGLRWSQASIQKNFRFKERHNFEIRADVDNVFKDPNFNNPSSTVNLSSPSLFGKPTGTTGGYCCLGGQFIITMGGKYTF